MAGSNEILNVGNSSTDKDSAVLVSLARKIIVPTRLLATGVIVIWATPSRFVLEPKL